MVEATSSKRIGFRGEQAVAEALQVAVRAGCQVFHDLPAPNAIIERLAIGPGGVLPIEATGRSPLLRSSQGIRSLGSPVNQTARSPNYCRFPKVEPTQPALRLYWVYGNKRSGGVATPAVAEELGNLADR